MTIVLVSGVPGSGKTTLARQLRDATGLPLLSLDTVKEAVVDGLGTMPDDRYLVRQTGLAVLAAIVTDNPGGAILDIWVDPTFDPADLLAMLESVPGATYREVICTVDAEVAVARFAARPRDHPSHLPADDGSPSVRTGCRDVVLGIDLGDACDEVIEFAFEAAQLRRARLRVVHAWQAPSPLGLGAGDVGLVAEPQRAEEWLGFLSAVLQVWREKYPDVEVAESVVEGKASNVLLRASSGAGLLVVGRRIADRPALTRTGPVTHAVVHHVGCPIAVVPHG